MATHRISILDQSYPDGSGSVVIEPSSNKLTNDRYPSMVVSFADTATKIGIRGSFTVPKNYVGTPKIVVVWAANNTAASAEVVWDFDYRAIAAAEPMDPSTDQENATVTTTAPTTAWNRVDSSITLTAANLAADDLVQFALSRDGANAADDMAQAAVVWDVLFEYADA